MKSLPLGTEDFKKVIENNYYYIDKTKSIEELLKNSAEVLLFTRPRRFGKTLFMSSLKYFYDIENSEENQKLFKDLYIEKSSFFKNQGTYPVLDIYLKDIDGTNFDEMLLSIKDKIILLIEKINLLNIELQDTTKDMISRIKQGEKVALANSLFTISRIYSEYYNKKVIILIDEYEAPLLNALKRGYQNEAFEFLKIFYSSALKSNNYLEKAILTGITRISQASIFSGLNNLKIYDKDNIKFADTFGFTQEEVNQALFYYKLDANKEAIKDYYDGYLFGEIEIYNPWSIMNFLDSGKLDSYWTQTANSSIIYKLLLDAPENIKKKYIALAKGESIIYTAINFLQLQLQDLSNPNKLFEFMISTGYLNYDSIKGQLKVVNKEVLSSLPDITENGLFTTNKDYINFKNAIRDNDLKLLEPSLNNLLGDIYSYFDFPKNSNESNYHVAITTLLAISGIGEVKSNLEAGLGRFDIAFTSNHPTCYSFIIEIKRASSKKEINNLLDESIKQVKDKNYLNYIKDREKKGIICFCFYQKQVRVKYELL